MEAAEWWWRCVLRSGLCRCDASDAECECRMGLLGAERCGDMPPSLSLLELLLGGVGGRLPSYPPGNTHGKQNQLQFIQASANDPCGRALHIAQQDLHIRARAMGVICISCGMKPQAKQVRGDAGVIAV